MITNSAEHGLIPQRDFFDKDIAVEGNTNNYYIIKKGDFVYNPRKSTTAPYGPFNCYRLEEEGIVSPLYTCLTPKHEEYTEFLLWYFKSPAWYSYIYHNGAQGGARHDRVGMTNELMDGIPVRLPRLREQEKISAFLSVIDRRIEAQRRLVNSLKSYKRGLIFSIFKSNNKYRIEMELVPMRALLEEYRIRETDGLRVCSVAVEKGVVDQVEHLGRSFAAADTSKYGRVEPNYVVYTKSPTGDFPYGIVKQNTLTETVAVSPLYGVYKPRTPEDGTLLHFYFEQHENANNYIRPLAQKGAKNTINITTDKFLDKDILFPKRVTDIHRLIRLFEVIDNSIRAQDRLLDFLNNERSTLLSQMFI